MGENLARTNSTTKLDDPSSTSILDKASNVRGFAEPLRRGHEQGRCQEPASPYQDARNNPKDGCWGYLGSLRALLRDQSKVDQAVSHGAEGALRCGHRV